MENFQVAVIGSGPAGLYTAEALFKSTDRKIAVDLFERLPMPYGLVRYGVAPDHQKIKSVTRAFDKTLGHPRLRFFGNVTFGRDVLIEELLSRYAAVVLAVGCETDKKLGIPGEELEGCYPATRFVAWYNGHPEFRDYPVTLDHSHAVVVGAGDVALDITRMLMQKSEALEHTDVTDYALRTFRESQVRKVTVVIRRGPAEAPFALKELRDLAELDQVQVTLDGESIRAAQAADSGTDSSVTRKLEFMRELAERPARGSAVNLRTVELLFLHSPVELLGNGGRMTAIRLEQNRLELRPGQAPRAVGSGEYRTLDAGLVFPAVGYRGIPLPGVPFDPARGIIPNHQGRVLDASGHVIPGLYVTGWIKRGPSGVIGTNKIDASETVAELVSDLTSRPPAPEAATAMSMEALLEQRGVSIVSLSDWQEIDRLEQQRGKPAGKIREKFTSDTEALAALKAARSG